MIHKWTPPTPYLNINIIVIPDIPQNAQTFARRQHKKNSTVSLRAYIKLKMQENFISWILLSFTTHLIHYHIN